jgi:hypothetical protein
MDQTAVCVSRLAGVIGFSTFLNGPVWTQYSFRNENLWNEKR